MIVESVALQQRGDLFALASNEFELAGYDVNAFPAERLGVADELERGVTHASILSNRLKDGDAFLYSAQPGRGLEKCEVVDPTAITIINGEASLELTRTNNGHSKSRSVALAAGKSVLLAEGEEFTITNAGYQELRWREDCPEPGADLRDSMYGREVKPFGPSEVTRRILNRVIHPGIIHKFGL